MFFIQLAVELCLSEAKWVDKIILKQLNHSLGTDSLLYVALKTYQRADCQTTFIADKWSICILCTAHFKKKSEFKMRIGVC